MTENNVPLSGNGGVGDVTPDSTASAQDLGAEAVYTENEVAIRYKVSPATVKNWRRTRTGPLYFYAGRHVRYRESALVAWEQEQERIASGRAS